MCVVSMILDHYRDKWTPYVPQVPQHITPVPWGPFPVPDKPRPVSPAEVDDLRRLFERAREYDRRNGEPDCELGEKKRLLKELAEKLGVNIDFIDGETGGKAE